MPPQHRRYHETTTTSNTQQTVDLISDEESDKDTMPSATRSKRRSPNPVDDTGPSAKRRKTGKDNTNTKTKRPSAPPDPEPITEISLLDEGDHLQNSFNKQQVDAVQSQQEGVKNFTTFQCVICLDSPTDLTATKCGIFNPQSLTIARDIRY
jgi:hypothetical protein